MFTKNVPQIAAVGFFDSSAKFRNMTVTSPRCVKYYELEFFDRDGGQCFINGKGYEIKKNMVLFAKPEQMRHSVLPFCCYFIKFEACDSGIFSFYENEPFMVSEAFFARAKKLIRQIAAYRESQNAGDELYAESRVLELFCGIKLELERIDPKGTADELLPASIAAAAFYMERNSDKQIDLNDIAKSANLSPVYFHQRFVRALGMTPHDYLLRLRINAAKQRLAMSGMPISKIAYEVGFSSQSYFNYAFKRETGMTPLKYRKSRHSKYEL